MITYRQVHSEEDYFQLMYLIREYTFSYLEEVMNLMELTEQQLCHYIKTVGKVFSIYYNDEIAGFYWIEEREKILHLHGIIIKLEFQGRGIGKEVLNMLIDKFKGRANSIELGVHKSNKKAKELYEHLGFKVMNTLEKYNFYIMKLHL